MTRVYIAPDGSRLYGENLPALAARLWRQHGARELIAVRSTRSGRWVIARNQAHFLELLRAHCPRTETLIHGVHVYAGRPYALAFTPPPWRLHRFALETREAKP